MLQKPELCCPAHRQKKKKLRYRQCWKRFIETMVLKG